MAGSLAPPREASSASSRGRKQPLLRAVLPAEAPSRATSPSGCQPSVSDVATRSISSNSHVMLAELWHGISSTWGNLPRALDAAGLGQEEVYDEDQLRCLCRQSMSDAGHADAAASLISDQCLGPWGSSGTPASPRSAVPRAALLVTFARCAPRQRFGDWANRMLLAYDDLGELAGILASGGRPQKHDLEALPTRTWARTRQMPITRKAFTETLALLEVHADDSVAWFEAICGDRSGKVLDFGSLARRIVAEPNLKDGTTAAKRSTPSSSRSSHSRERREPLLDPSEVAVRLIHAWGDLSNAFGLRSSRPSSSHKALGTVNSSRRRPGRHELRQLGTEAAAQAAALERGRLAALGQEQWERALRGPQNKRLLPEADVRAEASAQLERLARQTENGSVVPENLFPNLSDRLCVAREVYMPSEAITVRYSTAESGFLGPGLAQPQRPQAAALLEHRREDPTPRFGANPFLAMTMIGADATECSCEHQLKVPIDSQARCGVVTLRAPRPLHGGDVGIWILQLYASDDGIGSLAAVGASLTVRVVPAVPQAMPGRPEMVSAGRTATSPNITIAWTTPVPDEGGIKIFGHVVGIWNPNDCLETTRPLRICCGQEVRSPYCIEGLEPEAAYIFRVRCETSIGVGHWGPPTGPLTTIPQEPPKLDRPNVYNVGENVATVRWPTTPAKVESYEILVQPVGDNAGEPWVVGVIPPLPPSDKLQASGATKWTEAKITGLRSNTCYRFQVRAATAHEFGDLSEPSLDSCTKPGAPSPPGAPTNASMKLRSEKGSQDLHLCWSPPANDGGFPVVRYFVRGFLEGPANGGDKFLELYTRGPSPTLLARDLGGNARYIFKAFALNCAGLSLASPASEPIATGPVPPGPPRNPIVVDFGECVVSLRWEEPDDNGGTPVEHYEVEVAEEVDPFGRRLSPRSRKSFVAETPEPNIRLTGLRGNCAYGVRIRASNSAGLSSPVACSAITAPARPSPPGMPRNIGSGSPTVATITWTPPARSGGSPIVGYILTCHACSPDGHPEPAAFLTVETSTVQVDVANLQPRCQYRLYVQALSAEAGLGDASEWSPIVQTGCLPPMPPRPPELMSATSHTIILTWAVGEDGEIPQCSDVLKAGAVEEAIHEYEVAVVAHADEEVSVTQRHAKTLRASRPPLRFKGLMACSAYVFRMRRRSAAGWSGWSPFSQQYRTNDVWTKQEISDSLVARFGGSLGGAFNKLDSNCDGFINFDDLLIGFGQVGLEAVPEFQLRELFDEMDAETRGSVGVRAFMRCLRSFEMRTPSQITAEAVTANNIPQLDEDLECSSIWVEVEPFTSAGS